MTIWKRGGYIVQHSNITLCALKQAEKTAATDAAVEPEPHA